MVSQLFIFVNLSETKYIIFFAERAPQLVGAVSERVWEILRGFESSDGWYAVIPEPATEQRDLTPKISQQLSKNPKIPMSNTYSTWGTAYAAAAQRPAPHHQSATHSKPVRSSCRPSFFHKTTIEKPQFWCYIIRITFLIIRNL